MNAVERRRPRLRAADCSPALSLGGHFELAEQRHLLLLRGFLCCCWRAFGLAEEMLRTLDSGQESCLVALQFDDVRHLLESCAKALRNLASSIIFKRKAPLLRARTGLRVFVIRAVCFGFTPLVGRSV